MDESERMASALGGVPMPQPRPTYFDERWNVPNKYPTQDDVNISKKYDTAYGDPAAGFLDPNNGRIRDVPIELMPYVSHAGKEGWSTLDRKAGLGSSDSDTADMLRQSWIAAQKSPMAALGFEPRRTIASSPTTTELNVSGMYQPDTDLMWFDKRDPQALVHEGMHRGVQQLRQAGMTDLPHGMPDEMLVRALMLKNYGDVEVNSGLTNNKQIEQARSHLGSPFLDEMEKKAADLYHQKNRQMGPR